MKTTLRELHPVGGRGNRETRQIHEPEFGFAFRVLRVVRG
jgi:hypothetical protein